ncbi:putative transmembrane reductase CYB561D1 [Oratosquilla oratoria]|uniref:putative transmembrane reductase CYB561D1 n=1 Tax=Oratosquilla oratoria TaxID=337810 RepID=UPI003F760CDA
MDPIKASASGSSGEKRKKVMLSLEVKQEIIEKHESGVRISDLAKQYGQNMSTISTISKFTVCMTEAILVLSKNSIFGVFSRDKRILAHWLLLCFGALMEIAGFYAIYTNKMINDKPHFTSWHGLIGLITVILSCFQLSMGAFAKYPRLLSPVVKMKNVKFAHALFGGFVYLLGVVTIVISFYSAFSIGAFSRFIWILLFSVQLVLGFIVLRGVSSSYLPKLFR